MATLLRRQPKRPYQQVPSAGFLIVPSPVEVQRFQARAACHNYASKDRHGGLFVRARALAIAVDAKLQAGHLRARLNLSAGRGAALCSRYSFVLPYLHLFTSNPGLCKGHARHLVFAMPCPEGALAGKPADARAGLSGSAEASPDGCAAAHLRGPQVSACACDS